MLERQIGLFPSLPELEPVIGSLDARGAAAQAGLRVGDRVIAIDGQPVKTWQDMVKTVSARPDAALRLRVQRNGVMQEFTVTPQPTEIAGQRIGRIGVGVRIPELPADMRVMVRHAPLTAFVEGVETTWRMSALTLKMLGKMLKLQPKIYMSKFCSVKMIGTITLKPARLASNGMPNSFIQASIQMAKVERSGS